MASEQTDMTEVVDLSALPPNVPSLCIPRVFKNITRERVFNCFKDLGIGFVERIDMVPRKSDNGDEFQRVFVHLRWNNGEQARKARSRVLAGKEIKIIYDEPWFWKVGANRSVSRDTTRDGTQRDFNPRHRATLALEDDDLEGNIRRIKAQNDRDRKGGRFPAGHHGRPPRDTRLPPRPPTRDTRVPTRDTRPPRTAPVAVPRTPSSSPPRPAERLPSPELLSPHRLDAHDGGWHASPSPSNDHLDSAFDVDNPVDTPAVDYGDCGKLPISKKKRVIKKLVEV